MDKIIGFLGVGNMGGALATAVSRALSPNAVLLYDQNKDTLSAKAKLLRATPAASLDELVTRADVLFLGVKPAGLPAVLEAILPTLKGKKTKTLLVSMAAGVAMERIRTLTEAGFPIIRMMPNTPVAVGEGMIQYAASPEATEEDKNLFRVILDRAGVLDELPEDKIDAACALSGSGPAFAAIMAEALADAGVAIGLSRDKAILYAAQMMRGTATLILDGTHPAVLKDAVSSPGGTTIAGVRELERLGLRAAAEAAVAAAYRRALEMKAGK